MLRSIYKKKLLLAANKYFMKDVWNYSGRLRKLKNWPFLVLFIVLVQSGCHPREAQDLISPNLVSSTPKNFTFAVYDNDHNLLTTPVEDWIHYRQKNFKENGNDTNLYIISHGWDYTLQEGFAKYNAIVNSFNKYGREYSREETNTYFIFVVWPSASRPLTYAAHSLLPNAIDKTIAPVTELIDGTAFFLPSTWNQSINAYKNALGKYEPEEYLSIESLNGYHNGTIQANSVARNMPLSAVIYEILRKNEKMEASGNIKKQRIHVIGHSYGAKLIALATIEGLRRYSVNNPNKNTDDMIESMLLFNAAFHPSEMWYRDVGVGLRCNDTDCHSILKSIPRKAVIFSDDDYPNGRLFDISQMFYHRTAGQSTDQIFDTLFGDDLNISLAGGVARGLGGLFQLGWNVVVSVGAWTMSTALYIPSDFSRHVATDATFDWIGNGPHEKILNAIHFFLPVEELIPGGNALESGLFTPNTPSVGRFGLHAIAKARCEGVGDQSCDYNLGPFRNFVMEKDLPKKDQLIDAEVFEWMACGGEVPRLEFYKRNLVFSIDASDIYKTTPSLSPRDWVVGSHSDLIDQTDMVECLKPTSDDDQTKMLSTIKFISAFVSGQTNGK